MSGGDAGIDHFSAECFQAPQGSCLVQAHQAAVPDQIDDHDGSQSPFRCHSAWAGPLNCQGPPPASLLLQPYHMRLTQGSTSASAFAGAVEHSAIPSSGSS